MCGTFTTVAVGLVDLSVYMFLYSLTLDTMDDTTKCTCGNNPCTCPVAPAEEISTPEVAAEVTATETPVEETPAEESAAQ